MCTICRCNLQPLQVTPEEFENLKKEFFNNVIIGKNVFSKTTPAEMARFKDFVANRGKIDVVIDGLNVAYAVGTRQPPSVTSGFVSKPVYSV